MPANMFRIAASLHTQPFHTSEALRSGSLVKNNTLRKASDAQSQPFHTSEVPRCGSPAKTRSCANTSSTLCRKYDCTDSTSPLERVIWLAGGRPVVCRGCVMAPRPTPMISGSRWAIKKTPMQIFVPVQKNETSQSKPYFPFKIDCEAKQAFSSNSTTLPRMWK